MQFKFVLRLLDEQDQLLGWREIVGEAKTDHPGAASAPIFGVEGRVFPLVACASGEIRSATLHWCDMNTARVIPANWPAGTTVKAGQVVDFFLVEPLWMIPGEHNVALPPVTVTSNISIGTRPAVIGAQGQQA